MTTQAGDKVRLETTASTKSIPRATRREEYAVLVRVTAAPGAVSARADGVDLVAVLDISGSTSEEEGLERMKQAMVFVIDNLGPDDRLSVVSFDDQVQRRTELSQMSEGNRAVARAVVDKLTAAPAGGGGVNTTGATEEAAKILAQRGEDENTNRVGRIIFLSNGGDDDDGDVADPGQKQDSLTSPDLELSAEAFGLGADDSLSALSYGAGKTSGVYSYGKQDVDNIKDAHTHGFMSVDAALGVQIDLQAQEGVAISALGSGGHRVSVGTGVRGSVTIYIHDLYPGEHKSFIVYLTVPEDEERLLTVGGLYRDPDHGDDIQFDDTEVSVLRPDDAGDTADETICPGVAAELDRARRLVNLAMEANAKPIPMLELPQEDEGGVVEETIPDDKKPDNVPETLEIPVLVTEREDFTNQANKEKEEEGKLGKVEIIWVSNNPYYSGLIFAATVLLLGAAMLLTSNGGQKRARTSLVDISQHPGWPKMEKSLGLAMAKKVEDSGITSSLHGVSVEDMSRTIITYIHLALVHASGITRLEQRVQVLEAEKEELRVMVEAVTEEIAEEEMATSVACRDKNEAAVERAHTRIVELEQQLQGKKAFAESLRSEVANTDAHLVNCSHTVEMLEAKVREMEGAHPNIIHSR